MSVRKTISIGYSEDAKLREEASDLKAERGAGRGAGPTRVLHVVNRWSRGGVERYIESLMQAHPEGVEQSVLSICTPVESGVVKKGYGPLVKSDSLWSMLQGSGRLKAFLSGRNYDVVHIHTNNSSGFLYASAARSAGVGRRIVHSHNSSLGQDAGLVKRVAQSSMRAAFQGSETDRVACSRLAGEHLFGTASFFVVPNGIDTKRFAFDSSARQRIRTALSADDGCAVIGCVGSLVKVKNHKRAVDIFGAFHERNPQSKLVIIGEGELRSELESQVAEKGLSASVAFLGHVENTHEYYSAMDVLLFPSLFEGLPLTLVEAQCNGLPVVASDAISQEVKLLDSCVLLSLDKDDREWAQAISCAKRDGVDQSSARVALAGFDVSAAVQALCQLWDDGKSRVGAGEREACG